MATFNLYKQDHFQCLFCVNNIWICDINLFCNNNNKEYYVNDNLLIFFYFSDIISRKHYVSNVDRLWPIFWNRIRHESPRDRASSIPQHYFDMVLFHCRGHPNVSEKESVYPRVVGLHGNVVWWRMGAEAAGWRHWQVPARPNGLLHDNHFHFVLHSTHCDGCSILLCYQDPMDVKSSRRKDDERRQYPNKSQKKGNTVPTWFHSMLNSSTTYYWCSEIVTSK